MRTHKTAAIAAVTAVVAAAPALGSIVEYADFGAWSSAVGIFTTLDFTDLAHGEVVDTQYADVGVTFGGTAVGWTSISFPLDGHGVLQAPGAPLGIEVLFAEPRTEFAIHGLGIQYFVALYAGGIEFHVAASGVFAPFLGIRSTQPFDRVRMFGTLGVVNVDNLHFGAPIPAPAGIAVLLAIGLGGGRRRGFAVQSA